MEAQLLIGIAKPVLVPVIPIGYAATVDSGTIGNPAPTLAIGKDADPD